MDFRNLPAGARLGPYTLAERIGRGAFASVYRAVSDGGEHRAVKVRESGVPGHDRRFLREFESMRALRLPGVVRVYEAGLDEGLLWFAMDLVHGRPFDQIVQRLPTMRERARLAARLGVQLLGTLAALHRSGVIHRDVKPSNVLVDDRDRVHVLDFGIVRFFGDAGAQHTTRTGEVVGTAAFMAPEQLAGLPIDEKVDVWAAAILLYEAVAGKRERPSSAVAWIPRTCLERPIPLASRFKDVSRGLSHAVERMLSVHPDHRPDAATAEKLLRADTAGIPSREWPEPPFVEPGPWFEALSGCLGDGSAPSAQVIEGPAGCGKRRAAEQVQRQGLLSGVWTVQAECRLDLLGGPVGHFLERVVRTTEDEAWLRAVFDADADPVRRMWPHIGLPGEPAPMPMPTQDDIAAAVVRCLVRLAARRPTLWVVAGLESVDPLTARVLERLIAQREPRLGLLLLHDPRWATAASAGVRAQVTAARGRVHLVDHVDEDVAARIADGLAPETPPERLPRCRAQHAVESGLRRLAAWRGEAFAPPAGRLWPLALREAPIPSAVLRRLSGASALGDPSVREVDERVALDGALPTRAARARLADRRQAAAAVLRAWQAHEPIPAEDLVALRLLAGEDEAAFAPAARAAHAAERLGRYADARRCLLLVDALPIPAELSRHEAFELARLRARVAIRTEDAPPGDELVDACDRLASTPEESLDAQLIRAEVLLRRGELLPAIVAALRVAAAAAGPAPRVAARALLIATQARAAAGRLDEVSGELVRAEDLLRAHPDPVLAVQALSWRGELAMHHGDLAEARDLSVSALQAAARFGYVRGRAFAAARLARVLRQAGRRREAEHHVREALDAFAITGDVALHADARLMLATLLAERGDAAAARHLLDDTIRRIRQLRLERLLPAAMRVALLVATVRADPHDASTALSALDELGAGDAEAPAAISRWWRTRGDLDRARAVPPPARGDYGLVSHQVEQARCALVAGDAPSARDGAHAALDRARALGFRELELYASLVVGALGDPDPRWEERVARAADSLDVDVYLGALEMDARRRTAQGDLAGARTRWEALALRAREMGFIPGVDEARGWL